DSRSGHHRRPTHIIPASGGMGGVGGINGVGGPMGGLSDDEYNAMVEQREQLLALATDLCVLYARRTLLTLLARWPARALGRGFELADLCRTPPLDPSGPLSGESGLVIADSIGGARADEASAAAALVRLLALASAEGPTTQLHVAALALQAPGAVPLGAVGSAAALLSIVQQALHAGGAPALRMVAPSITSAVQATCSGRNRGGGGAVLLSELARSVASTVLVASGRDYALQLAGGTNIAGGSPGAAMAAAAGATSAA
ncbi:unnamed protein product, partial [Phaeothamnion confervicola]